MAKQDMQYFLENEIEPTSEQANELATTGYVDISEEAENEPEAKTVEEKVVEEPTESLEDAGSAKDVKAGTTEKTSEDVTDTEEELPISTKDGSSTIPYSVLKGSRQQVMELKSQFAEIAKENEELRRKIEEAQAASTTTTQPQSQEVTQDTLLAEFQRKYGQSYEDFVSEYGEEQAKFVITPLRENLELRNEFVSEFQSLRQELAERQAREESLAIDTLQAAIDANPTLSDWQQNDEAMWEAAKAVDNVLKVDPDWSGRSYQDRFAEVVRRLGRNPEPTVKEEPEDVEKKADEALKKAGKPVPTSLSSISGGTPAAETLRDKAEGMSNAELLAQMADPAKMQELLDSL